MTKQIPNWLFGVVIVGFTVGFLGLLGSAMKSSPTKAAAVAGGMTGTMATDFAGKTGDGKEFRLSDYRGKVVLVNLWATWCGPCRMEMPDLMKLQAEFGSKGFTIIGVSNDDSLETAAAFAKENKLNYPIMLATPEIVSAFGNPQGIPASFLLNKDGKIVWEQQGVDPNVSMYSTLKAEIEPRL